jgi:hypothetical protein
MGVALNRMRAGHGQPISLRRRRTQAVAERGERRFGFSKPIPIFPKSSQIEPSPAKDNQRKSLNFFRRIELLRWTPSAFFRFWAASGPYTKTR